MTTLQAYLPQDRLRALRRGKTLPDRTTGSALFADISGFTALTESLREKLGARQGVEELTRQLGAVYSALITEVEKYDGSVIGFAGDAMMCWFDLTSDTSGVTPFPIGEGGWLDKSAAQRAMACAFGMQEVIQTFPALALKVAVTTGAVRRFVVGQPEVQRLDVLAGATVSRTSSAEHQANTGEVIADEATINVLGHSLSVTEWRTGAESKERFAVVAKYAGEVIEAKTEILDSLAHEILQNWIHRTVFERETSSQDGFLTEFRPCVALFVRFTGIDYDSETAESELDAFIRQVQTITGRHHGTLLDITVGDKGSYAYINFGALSAHEDDSRRAVKTALELKDTSSLPLQTGITQGVMRVGAYGGEMRKTFGALGDDVNLAARLMTTAAPGEILLSSHVYKAVEQHFSFEPRAPLPIKGKAEPLPVFAVTGELKQRAIRLQEPTYALPMVGRQSELQLINGKLELALQGKSQVIGIVAEAGIGKSRLVAEVIRAARRKGFAGYGGACQSDGTSTSYLAWKSIWSAFFGVDPELSIRKQIRLLEGEIEDRAPERVQAMPLLNSVLDLDMPENDFTSNLEPEYRKSALHVLLEDCLRAASKDGPIFIVVEDLHWIDALSHDLLEELSKALANSPICFVLAYRPPQVTRLQAPRLEALPQFTKIELHELNQAEAESAIRAKLVQLYPARSGAVPVSLVDKLMARAQGNPFYLEELLNYLRDRGLDPLDPADWEKIELPDSLHALVFSRIDQLSEREKTTLRVASIVGRLFRAAWLNGYYPELGPMPQVRVVLDQLAELDITPLHSESELVYLFRHIVTHEVTYESMPFATRARLHEQLARYLESVDASLEAIAFHYGRSENKEKQREYLHKAGEAAQKSFANDAALEYYGRLLSLIGEGKEQAEIHLKRGEVFGLLGKWDDAEGDYRLALDSANDAALRARGQYALGRLNSMRGDYQRALDWLAQAKEERTALEDIIGLAQVLNQTGHVMGQKGEYAQARQLFNEALALARRAGGRLQLALALNNLGNVATTQGDNKGGKVLYEESLAVSREIGDKVSVAGVLNNLGSVALNQSDYTIARASYEESLALYREIGNKPLVALSLQNLGVLAHVQGDNPAARRLYEESLILSRAIGSKWEIALALGNLGLVAYTQGDYLTARALQDESLSLRREIGDKWGIAVSLNNLGLLVICAQSDYAAARAFFEESLALCKDMAEKSQMAFALLGLGLVDAAEGKPEARQNILQSLRLRQEQGERLTQTSSLIGIAVLVLRDGNPQFTAQLLGAVKSILREFGAVVEPEVRPIYTQTLAAVRERLDEAAFQSAWEEGSKWSLEEAVNKALAKYGE